MSNNNEKECKRDCKNTSSSWTRRSSDPCALRERYAQSEGSHLHGVKIRERQEHVLDINKFRHPALNCDNSGTCNLEQKHDEAMHLRIDIENELKRLNRLSSKCVKNKYNPEMETNNNVLLTNEVSTNCRIPSSLYK